MKLPEHIKQISAKWYKNTVNGKFIPADKIENWLNSYWQYRYQKDVRAQKLYQKEKNLAKIRWDL